MKLNLVAFLFGALLLAISILGGGFELQELKIPKVGWFPRLVSAFIGMFFIVVGIGLETPSVTSSDSSSPPTASTATEFIISDRLGEGQISEQVGILIDGKLVGTITVNEHFPESTIRVSVPQSGKYSYTVDAKAVFNVQGEQVAYPGVGQGNIDVQSGDQFELVGSISGNTWLITLQE